MKLKNILAVRLILFFIIPRFQLKKQAGFALERRFPGQFIPRYAMVVFHPEIPYAEARRRSEIEDGILEKLCAGISSPQQVDWEAADALVGRMNT